MKDLTFSRLGAVGMLVFVLMVLALNAWMSGAPSPLPENAPADQFSAFRALKHIREMTRDPHHRTGTPANQRVRAYIEQQLRDMGVPYEVTTTPTKDPANPENVIARLPGDGTYNKAFFAAAHYDSVPYGPGAADDLTGVAAMIEALRVLKASPKLKNDVIFLFSDGEERGLLGPKAFMEHPWAKDVGFVFNMEARGIAGPSIMFETTDQNGEIIPHILRAAEHPITNSLGYELFRRMPFSSDFGIMKHYYPGCNAAFIGYFAYYHTPFDNADELSPGSVQHHGSYLTSFAKYFGNMQMDTLGKAPNAVYFNTFGYKMVWYPGSWVRPLMWLTVGLFVCTLALGMMRKRLCPLCVLLGALATLLTIIVAAGLPGGIHAMAYKTRTFYMLYMTYPYAIGALLMGSSITWMLYGPVAKRLGYANAAMGTLLLWVAAGCAMSIYMPGASYAFDWPAIGGLLGVMGFLFTRDPEKPSPMLWVWLAFCALPGALILSNGARLLLHALSGGIGGPFVIIFVVMQFGALLVALGPSVTLWTTAWRERRPWRFVPVAMLALGVCFSLYAWAAGGPSPRHPKMSCLIYALDGDTGKAWWLTSNSAFEKTPMDDYTRLFFKGNEPMESISEFSYDTLCMKAEAPVAPIEPPRLELVSQEPRGEGRLLKFMLSSPRQGVRVRMMVKSEAKTLAFTMDGRNIGERKEGEWREDYLSFPLRPVEMSMEMSSSAPVTLVLVDVTYEFPEIPGYAMPERPAHIINQANTITFDRALESGTAIARKTYTF